MSAAGLADELAALDIGDSVARVLRVPVTRNAGGQRDDFRSNIRARVAKTAARLGKTFSSMTMDKVTDDFMTAVTVVVITRTA